MQNTIKGGMMKKFIILSLMAATMVIFVPSAEAAAAPASVTADPQINVQIGPRRGRRWRNRRVVTTTRVRWINGVRYRETVRITYFANGRTRTQVISRVRVGGRRFYRNY